MVKAAYRSHFRDSMKWILRFMDLADTVATWSQDPSTKVGAVIVGCKRLTSDDSKRVLGLGFNGFPRGVQDLPERYADRPTKYKMIVHSEANAILDARGRDITGGFILTTKFPCTECAKLIIQAQLRGVFCPPFDEKNAADQRWLEDARTSLLMFEEAGVSVVAVGSHEGIYKFELP